MEQGEEEEEVKVFLSPQNRDVQQGSKSDAFSKQKWILHPLLFRCHGKCEKDYVFIPQLACHMSLFRKHFLLFPTGPQQTFSFFFFPQLSIGMHLPNTVMTMTSPSNPSMPISGSHLKPPIHWHLSPIILPPSIGFLLSPASDPSPLQLTDELPTGWTKREKGSTDTL